MQLDHVNVRTSDLEAMRTFFENVIGLTVGDRPPFQFPGYWLYSEGHPAIHLVQGEPDGAGPVDHVAFRCSGLDDMRKQLTDAGAEFAERTVPLTGAVQLFVKGPEQVQVELQFPDGK